MRSKDKQVFSHVDVITADVQLSAGVAVEIGRIKCPANQYLGMGYGGNLGQMNSLGRAYFDPQIAAGTGINGELRILRYDSNNYPIGKVFAGHTNELRLGATARTERMVFEDKNMQIKEDSEFVFFFVSDGSELLDKAKTTMYLDGMKYLL